MSKGNAPPPMVWVYGGQNCIGFVVWRGKRGVEAFSTSDGSLGVFKSRGEAAVAITKLYELEVGAAHVGATH
jgi:hypothetical protein